MLRKIPLEPIVGLLVMLFVYTAINKLLDFSEFVGQMRNQPIPNWMSEILIWFIPISELLISGSLMIKPIRSYALLCSVLILLVFTIYAGLILANQFEYIPCSCAGIFEQMSWRTHFVVNIVLTLIALLGLMADGKMKRTLI